MAPQPAASTSAQPLPENFSRPQAKKAVDALLKHHEKVVAEREDTELISRDEYVYLVVNTKRGNTKRKMMPKRIQLPNPPLPPPPATTIALITKPPQRQYKDLLASSEHNIKFVNRVVDTDKLRGKWKPFEARRNLARENDIWLADERIVPSLPKLLGKVFFDAKKTPIPVNLSRKDLKAELGRAINSTYFHPSTGTSNSIRIATPEHTSAAQTLENLLAATPAVVALIQDGWENVLSIGIKTSTSVLLPIYSAQLEGRFAIPPKSDEDGDVSMSAAESKKNRRKGKGKDEKNASVKRPAEEVAEVAPTKEKKAKATAESPAKKAKTLPTPETKKDAAPSALTKVKKVAAPSDSPSKADKVVKKTGKKSSSLGTGSAGKKAKQAVLGRSK